MLSNGTGVQNDFNANLPFTQIGVANAPFTPTTIKSGQIDPSEEGNLFIPGKTWVSRTSKGTIIRGIAPNSNLMGLTMRGASLPSDANGEDVGYSYEDGVVPVGTGVTSWIKVVSAPSAVETYGIAINDETGQATCYANSATAGYFTTGEAGDLSVFQEISDGSISVQIDGGTATAITGIDFTSAESMQDVAEILEAAITAGLSTVYVTYDQQDNTFTVTSPTEGSSSAIALAADATGTSLYLAAYLNAAGGAATAGVAAGTAPTGYTAAPGIKINRWSAQDSTYVEVSFPSVSLEG